MSDDQTLPLKDETLDKAKDITGEEPQDSKTEKVTAITSEKEKDRDENKTAESAVEDAKDDKKSGEVLSEREHSEQFVDEEDEADMKEKTDSESSINLVIDEEDFTEEKIDGTDDESKTASAEVVEIDDDGGEPERVRTSEGNIEMPQITEKPITVIEIDDEDEEVEDDEKKQVKNTNAIESGENMDIDVPTTTTEAIDVDMENSAVEVKENDSEVSSLMKNTEETKSKVDPDDWEKKEATELYYNKDCANFECAKKTAIFLRAAEFVLSYFNVINKKAKPMYVCLDCNDEANNKYDEMSRILLSQQPFFSKNVIEKRHCGEILDSSDEDDNGQSVERPEKAPPLSQTAIDLINEELENSIVGVFEKINIQQQLTWAKTILEKRAAVIAKDNEVIAAELNDLEEKLYGLSHELSSCGKLRTREVGPWDLDTERAFEMSKSQPVPPPGVVQRPPIELDGKYYAVKGKVIASWVPCTAVELMDSSTDVKQCKIKFLKSQYQMFRTVSVKHMAYFDPPPVRLPIGERVIAYFDATSVSMGRGKLMAQSAFYPGVIAEQLKPQNRYRYLIFYDDGYTQYVYHKDVRLVCHASKAVWEDVHPGSREFIHKYVTEYSTNRPMVQPYRGQCIKTETNGRWPMARVIDIDCSLIKMQFENTRNHTEWIYRGSLRLGPVLKEYQKKYTANSSPLTSRLAFRTGGPSVRYTNDEELYNDNNKRNQPQSQPQPARPTGSRAVAKKSTTRPNTMTPFQGSQPTQPARYLNNSTVYLDDESQPKGKVTFYTAKRHIPPLPYKPHNCSPACMFKIPHDLSSYSPLAKPLLSGWERLVIRQKIKKMVCYRAPCGKMMRNMKELHRYLRSTDNVLNVENFDFSELTYCLAEYTIDGAIVHVPDISEGLEKMALPLVNYYDNTMPPQCKYANKRIPTNEVHINTDQEFMICCDCEDDCLDKEKCACWQLTYESAKHDASNKNIPKEEIGYEYKRLYHPVLTGIYECNSRCKCNHKCLNRVVQHSLNMKLQVFKTSNRGWGLRCINAVPRGSFICIYAGHLLTESQANEGGMRAGDEYMAELDYIEVAEQMKDGYESEPEPEPTYDDCDEDDDDEFKPSKSFEQRNFNKQWQTRGSSSTQEEESQERQVINFNPETNQLNDEDTGKLSATRKYFGRNEAIYVMDAKITGNLGRYFNHSCAPNLFVQNVFVDTHDLRFPWVAFFASQDIRAGAELTWNYNYEVGVVPGKVLYCQCGAPNCRLRLL